MRCKLGANSSHQNFLLCCIFSLSHTLNDNNSPNARVYLRGSFPGEFQDFHFPETPEKSARILIGDFRGKDCPRIHSIVFPNIILYFSSDPLWYFLRNKFLGEFLGDFYNITPLIQYITVIHQIDPKNVQNLHGSLVYFIHHKVNQVIWFELYGLYYANFRLHRTHS